MDAHKFGGGFDPKFRIGDEQLHADDDGGGHPRGVRPDIDGPNSLPIGGAIRRHIQCQRRDDPGQREVPPSWVGF